MKQSAQVSNVTLGPFVLIFLDGNILVTIYILSLSRSTISNIFNTLVHALHEMLYVGVVDTCFPSQLKCKGLYDDLHSHE